MNIACQSPIDPRFLTSMLLVSAFLSSLPSPVPAADQIWIEPKPPTANQSGWYPKTIKTMVGEVVRFNAGELVVVIDGDDAESNFPANRVIWIEPQQRPAAEAELIGQFKAGRYRQALELLPGVLETRPPIWRQQSITMMAAVAATRCGRATVAMNLISQLDRRPLPPMVIAWLPIQWTNRQTEAGTVAAAIESLDDSSPLVKLIAASWLLSSPRRSEGIASLRSLTSDDRSEVAMLAKVLQWRTATPLQVSESINDWQQSVDRMPMVWQTGPTKTLIDKLQSAGLSERAKPLQWSQELTPIHPFP